MRPHRWSIYHVDAMTSVRSVLIQRRNVAVVTNMKLNLSNDISQPLQSQIAMKKLAKLLLVSIMILWNAKGFLVELELTGKKCFLMTIFPQENLLLEIESPMIQQKIAISVSVSNDGKKIFEKQLSKSTDRITVDMNNSPKPGSIQQVEGCIQTKLQQQISSQLANKKYLVWISQVSNFKHEIKSKKPQKIPQKSAENPSKSKQNYIKQILGRTQRIQELYEEEIQIYKTNEIKEKNNEKSLQSLESKIFIITTIQIVLILLITSGYILILSKMI